MLFLFKRNEKKNRKGTLAPKMPFAADSRVARWYSAYVSCKMSFSNISGVHPLVGCSVSAASSSSNT